MSLYKQFKLDAKKETEGIEIKFSANDDGTVPTFRILHMNQSNAKYAKVLEQESKPYRRQMQLEALSDADDKKIMLRTFCRSILIGWSNVQKEDGTPYDYTFENAMKLMTDLPLLYQSLLIEAAKSAQFRELQLADEAKN